MDCQREFGCHWSKILVTVVTPCFSKFFWLWWIPTMSPVQNPSWKSKDMRKEMQLYWNTFIKKVLKVTVQKCLWETAWWNEGPMTLIVQRWFGLGSVGCFFWKAYPNNSSFEFLLNYQPDASKPESANLCNFQILILVFHAYLICMLFSSHTPRSLTCSPGKNGWDWKMFSFPFWGQRPIFRGFCCLIWANLEIYLQICVYRIFTYCRIVNL